MSEYICRLGTPSGEIVTRIVEAAAAADARLQLEREGFRVFNISDASGGVASMLPFGGSKKGKVKQADFLLFNQQLSALLRAGIPVLQSINLLKTRSGSSNLRDIPCRCRRKDQKRRSAFRSLRSPGRFSKDLHRVDPFRRKERRSRRHSASICRLICAAASAWLAN